MKKRYRIVNETESRAFEALVEQALADGWELQGGLVVTNEDSVEDVDERYWAYHQAMTKDEVSEGD